MCCVVLDDHQGVVPATADWSSLDVHAVREDIAAFRAGAPVRMSAGPTVADPAGSRAR